MFKFSKFRYIPWVLWMMLIFYGSHQTIDPSAPPPEWMPLYILDLMKIQHMDKIMHITEYLILGILGVIATGERKLLAFKIGILFAISDEIHQSFIPGRFSDFFDVCADIVGLSIATFVIDKHILKLFKKKGDSN